MNQKLLWKVFPIAMLAFGCGSDDQAGNGQGAGHTADELLKNQNAYASEVCSCLASDADQQQCVDQATADGFTACQTKALMDDINANQKPVDCVVELYQDAVDCVRAAECDQAALNACSDMTVNGLQDCPRPSQAAQNAVAACD